MRGIPTQQSDDSLSFLTQLFSLSGKRAIVTGAARGNGAAIADALLRAGAEVIAVDVLAEELNQRVDEWMSQSLPAKACCCDLSLDDGIKCIADQVSQCWVELDILVNNAGITIGNSLDSYTLDDWERTYRVNLRAPFRLTQILAPHLRTSGSASVINITSLNAEQAFPGNPAYVAFKGGLKQLSKALALDLGQSGVRVNCVGPGYFRTDMTCKSWNDPQLRRQRSERTILGRWGETSDLAGIVVFLASDSSSYITGQDFYVDGGWLARGL